MGHGRDDASGTFMLGPSIDNGVLDRRINLPKMNKYEIRFMPSLFTNYGKNVLS
jgi:hypothetical protein